MIKSKTDKYIWILLFILLVERLLLFYELGQSLQMAASAREIQSGAQRARQRRIKKGWRASGALEAAFRPVRRGEAVCVAAKTRLFTGSCPDVLHKVARL